MEMVSRRNFAVTSLKAVVLFSTVGRFLAACGAAAALPFITMGLNLIGTILPTIPSIIAAIGSLVGKTIPATTVTKLTEIFTGVQTLFQQAQSALTQYQANNDPTLITKIQDILGQVKSSLAVDLAALQITDSATVAKVTLIFNSFIDLANNLLAILPSVVGGKVVARKVSHAQLANVTPDAWATRFNRAVSKPSGSKDVDDAFANVQAVAKSSS